MATKPLIKLYNTSGIGVIINFPSGVIYSNQAGGTSCLQPEAEGVYVPLFNQVNDQEKKLYDYFTDPKRMWFGSAKISEDDADFIDKILGESVFTSFIKVDRDRLDDSHEAWVHVAIGTQPQEHPQSYDGSKDEGITASGQTISSKDYDMSVILYPFYGFGKTSGILTWVNSD